MGNRGRCPLNFQNLKETSYSVIYSPHHSNNYILFNHQLHHVNWIILKDRSKGYNILNPTSHGLFWATPYMGGAHCAPPIFSMCSTNGNTMKLSGIKDLGKLCLHAKFWSYNGHGSLFMTSQRLKTIENNRKFWNYITLDRKLQMTWNFANTLSIS